MAKVLRWPENLSYLADGYRSKRGLLAWLKKLFLGPEQPKYPKGLSGEIKVAQELANKLNDHWTVINDITITVGGCKNQIDHLLVGPPGVFCIETKNWNTASCNEQGDWFRLQQGMWVPQKSPLEQIRAKLGALSKLFSQMDISPNVQGIIVFANPGKFNFTTAKLTYDVMVFGLPGLIAYLQQIEKQAASYSEQDIVKFLEIINL